MFQTTNQILWYFMILLVTNSYDTIILYFTSIITNQIIMAYHVLVHPPISLWSPGTWRRCSSARCTPTSLRRRSPAPVATGRICRRRPWLRCRWQRWEATTWSEGRVVWITWYPWRIHGAGIYANIWGILMVNVTIYSIHGSYGV